MARAVLPSASVACSRSLPLAGLRKGTPAAAVAAALLWGLGSAEGGGRRQTTQVYFPAGHWDHFVVVTPERRGGRGGRDVD